MNLPDHILGDMIRKMSTASLNKLIQINTKYRDLAIKHHHFFTKKIQKTQIRTKLLQCLTTKCPQLFGLLCEYYSSKVTNFHNLFFETNVLIRTAAANGFLGVLRYMHMLIRDPEIKEWKHRLDQLYVQAVKSKSSKTFKTLYQFGIRCNANVFFEHVKTVGEYRYRTLANVFKNVYQMLEENSYQPDDYTAELSSIYGNKNALHYIFSEISLDQRLQCLTVAILGWKDNIINYIVAKVNPEISASHLKALGFSMTVPKYFEQIIDWLMPVLTDEGKETIMNTTCQNGMYYNFLILCKKQFEMSSFSMDIALLHNRWPIAEQLYARSVIPSGNVWPFGFDESNITLISDANLTLLIRLGYPFRNPESIALQCLYLGYWRSFTVMIQKDDMYMECLRSLGSCPKELVQEYFEHIERNKIEHIERNKINLLGI